MRALFLFLQLCISIGFVSTMAGQRFPCDGQLLIGANDGVSTTMFRPLYIPFSPPFLSPFAKYQNGSFDALGFNSKDNYIYGVQENTNTIVKLKRNNSFEIVGTV
jgi:hypothetical protein